MDQALHAPTDELPYDVRMIGLPDEQRCQCLIAFTGCAFGTSISGPALAIALAVTRCIVCVSMAVLGRVQYSSILVMVAQDTLSLQGHA